MPWLRFSETFDWRPHPRQMIRFRAGIQALVTTPCAELAIASGKAERIATPTRDEAAAIKGGCRDCSRVSNGRRRA